MPTITGFITKFIYKLLKYYQMSVGNFSLFYFGFIYF